MASLGFFPFTIKQKSGFLKRSHTLSDLKHCLGEKWGVHHCKKEAPSWKSGKRGMTRDCSQTLPPQDEGRLFLLQFFQVVELTRVVRRMGKGGGVREGQSGSQFLCGEAEAFFPLLLSPQSHCSPDWSSSPLRVFFSHTAKVAFTSGHVSSIFLSTSLERLLRGGGSLNCPRLPETGSLCSEYCGDAVRCGRNRECVCRAP